MQTLKQTSLYNFHQQLGARIVPFAGWDMPVQYKGVIEEHCAVREQAGLFDVSHMGEIFVTGVGARDFIQNLITNNITKIGNGQCQYSVCCYEDGGVVDDVIVYQFNTEKFMVIVNAANVEKDFSWMQKNKQKNVQIENKSDVFSLLALQGPKACEILWSLVDVDLTKLKYFSFCETLFGQHEVILSRTGYTGEDGFEICCAWDSGPEIWQQILKAGQGFGIQPIGLAARNTLRLEAAYSLYGHEISESINPLEANLGWVVALDKAQFIGKKALQKTKSEGAKRKLIGLEMVGKGIARDGYKVFGLDGEVGYVTSGSYAPTLQKSIALALVDAGLGTGIELFVQVRNQKLQARIIKLPFYER